MRKTVKPDGSSCSSGMDLSDSEQKGEIVGSISLSASSEEEGGGRHDGWSGSPE